MAGAAPAMQPKVLEVNYGASPGDADYLKDNVCPNLVSCCHVCIVC